MWQLRRALVPAPAKLAWCDFETTPGSSSVRPIPVKMSTVQSETQFACVEKPNTSMWVPYWISWCLHTSNRARRSWTQGYSVYDWNMSCEIAFGMHCEWEHAWKKRSSLHALHTISKPNSIQNSSKRNAICAYVRSSNGLHIIFLWIYCAPNIRTQHEHNAGTEVQTENSNWNSVRNKEKTKMLKTKYIVIFPSLSSVHYVILENHFVCMLLASSHHWHRNIFQQFLLQDSRRQSRNPKFLLSARPDSEDQQMEWFCCYYYIKAHKKNMFTHWRG